ncbi:MAG: hypothetical protein AAB134_06775 [Pseudomonadota bacterium]
MGFLLPPGEGHDGMDAGGRATQGAVAEDEGCFTGILPLTLALPEGEGENNAHYLSVGSVSPFVVSLSNHEPMAAL